MQSFVQSILQPNGHDKEHKYLFEWEASWKQVSAVSRVFHMVLGGCLIGNPQVFFRAIRKAGFGMVCAKWQAKSLGACFWWVAFPSCGTISSLLLCVLPLSLERAFHYLLPTVERQNLSCGARCYVFPLTQSKFHSSCLSSFHITWQIASDSLGAFSIESHLSIALHK